MGKGVDIFLLDQQQGLNEALWLYLRLKSLSRGLTLALAVIIPAESSLRGTFKQPNLQLGDLAGSLLICADSVRNANGSGLFLLLLPFKICNFEIGSQY